MPLYTASFRGVPFKIRGSGVSAGRRVALYEYPQKDKPYAEDMGRASRVITLDAFVIGADYVQQTERLIGALETPGEGKLVHPWLGEMTCTATANGEINYSDTDRIASCSLTFTESGELTFPTVSSATDFLSRMAADSLLGQSLDAFTSKFSLVSDAMDLALDADRVLSSAVSEFTSIVDGVAAADFVGTLQLDDALGELKNSASSLISSGAGAIADGVQSALNVASLGRTQQNWRAAVISASDAVSATALAPLSSAIDTVTEVVPSIYSAKRRLKRAAVTVVSSGSSSRTALSATDKMIDANTDALRELFRQTITAQAVGMSSLIGTAGDIQASGISPAVAIRDDVLSCRAALVSILNAEEGYVTNTDQIEAVRTARSSVWNDLSSRAENARQLVTVNLPAPVPALVLAYQRYGDALRDQEIIDRNRINNPNFVSGEVKLLDK